MAPKPVVEVTAIGGGITNTKWLLRMTGGEPLVIRWSDPAIWGEIGREHGRPSAAYCSPTPRCRCRGSSPVTWMGPTRVAPPT
jgi:hypothetical protein